MTTEQKTARRKLSLLELASEMHNVSKACQAMGYSRQQFYEIRRNYQVYGAEGLIDRLPGCRGPHPNRVSAEVEKAILDHCLENPTQGCLRVAQELFALLLEEELISAEMVEKISGWRHSGFPVHSKVRTETREEAERVGKYMIR